VLHIFGQSEYLFRSKSPEFWILQIGREHGVHLAWSPPPNRSCALIKPMRL
jgi:hypothetical protein